MRRLTNDSEVTNAANSIYSQFFSVLTQDQKDQFDQYKEAKELEKKLKNKSPEESNE